MNIKKYLYIVEIPYYNDKETNGEEDRTKSIYKAEQNKK